MYISLLQQTKPWVSTPLGLDAYCILKELKYFSNNSVRTHYKVKALKAAHVRPIVRVAALGLARRVLYATSRTASHI